jgi:hypothetical protein
MPCEMMTRRWVVVVALLAVVALVVEGRVGSLAAVVGSSVVIAVAVGAALVVLCAVIDAAVTPAAQHCSTSAVWPPGLPIGYTIRQP